MSHVGGSPWSDDVYFTYVIYACRYDFLSNCIWKYLYPSIGLLLPIFLIAATSVHLLVIAKKIASRSREGLKWQGIITTVLTATVFCLSWLPRIVIRAMLGTGSKSNVDLVTILKFARTAQSFIYLNTMCNFYIYCLTVTSFRNFVLSILQLLIRTSTFSVTRGKEIYFLIQLR